jgi:NhaP-type Na+/H+ or K+/H+ antiporter
VIGLLTGFVIKETLGELSKFDAHLFFNFMLPFLILGAGYNMKRRRFFRNIGPILMLGVGGTLIAFIVIGLFCYLWSEADLIYDKHGDRVHITLQEAMMVGATLSATDVVCTLALVKEQKTPRLHSILFGESASNDAIAILLLASLNNVSINEISAGSVFKFVGEFIYNCTTSTLLGIVFGALSAYITKRFRSLRDWPSRETAMLLYIAWIGYVVAELLDISGVICILVCAIVSGHYAMYNLSPAARTVSHNFFHFVGDASEALVFAYLGLTAYSYDLFSVPPLFLMAMFFSTMIARFCGTFILSLFCTLITWGKHNLGAKNLSIIWLGGVARGGVSFALVLTMTGGNSEVLQSSILALVIVGTLVFGTVLPLWILLMDVKEAAASIIEPHGAHGEADPHAAPEVPEENEKKKGWFHRKWRHIDDNYIKKWLIHEDELKEQARIRESMTRHREEADGEIVTEDRIIH